MPDVYIAYATGDRAIAEALVLALESEGIRVWIAPRDVIPGGAWADQIVEAIERVPAVMVVWSADSENSRHMQDEIELAKATGKTVIFVALNKIDHSRLPRWSFVVDFEGWNGRRDSAEFTDLRIVLEGAPKGRMGTVRSESAAAPRPVPPDIDRAAPETTSSPSGSKHRSANEMLKRVRAPRVQIEYEPQASATDDEEMRAAPIPSSLSEVSYPQELFAPPLPAPSASASSSAPESGGGISVAGAIGALLVAPFAYALDKWGRKSDAPAPNETPAPAVQRRRESPKQAGTDEVEVSAFAPRGGQAGQQIMVQIFLHLEKDASRAETAATASDPDAKRRAKSVLDIELFRGQSVDIVLESRDMVVDAPAQRIIWRGEPASAAFLVTFPKDKTWDSFALRASICAEGAPIGSLGFSLKLDKSQTAAAGEPQKLDAEAQRYRRVFLSYASYDRPEVLRQAQILSRLGVSFFQDILSLDPGERWEHKLFTEIDRCDGFFLYWSSHAAQSEWVIREAEYASARLANSREHIPRIVPVVIEGPPVPAPPKSLSHLHFNDPINYLIAAAKAERDARTGKS